MGAHRADQGMEESAGGVTTKLRVEGGERTRSLGVGGRTRASERASTQAGPVWN